MLHENKNIRVEDARRERGSNLQHQIQLTELSITFGSGKNLVCAPPPLLSVPCPQDRTHQRNECNCAKSLQGEAQCGSAVYGRVDEMSPAPLPPPDPPLPKEDKEELDFQVENQPRAAFVPIYQYPSQKMLEIFFLQGGGVTWTICPRYP